MRRPVLVAAVLSGALLIPALSPLGGTAAFADGSDPSSSPSTPACPAPSGSALAVSASAPATVASVGGRTSETISLSASAWLIGGELDYQLTPPAGGSSPTSAPVVTATFDGQGPVIPGIVPFGSGWDVLTPFGGQMMAGSHHTLVLAVTFTSGMPHGRYSTNVEWDSPQNCDGVSSPDSANYVVSLPSLNYDPPSATQSGGAVTPSGRATASTTASASFFASPSATASESTSQSATESGALAPTTASAPDASGRAVALARTSATSSGSDTTLMLAALVIVLLAAGVGGGFLIRRRRTVLQGAATGGEIAGPKEVARSSEAAEFDGPADPSAGSSAAPPR